MKKIVMIVEGISEAELLKVMTCPKLQALMAVLTVKLKADQFYFGAGKSVPVQEVERQYASYSASLN